MGVHINSTMSRRPGQLLLRPCGRASNLKHCALKGTSVSSVLSKLWYQQTCKAVQPEVKEELKPVLHEDASVSAKELGWNSGFSERYLMRELIGSGSFGQVYVGVHKQRHLEYAVKTMRKVRGKCTRELTLSKIVREAGMLQRAQACQGVVQLMECFEDADSVQLVTEWCSGGDLKKYVEVHGTLDERKLALVALEVLRIVQGCHAQGILYGDVKPANFCLVNAAAFDAPLTLPRRLKAVDFGCSQQLGNGRLSARSGTMAFMAPEIFAQDYAHKADVWSTGVMLYWLFSRRLPFWEGAEIPSMCRVEQMADAVSHAPIRYDYGPWHHMSAEGLDFMRACLTRPEAARLSVEEALQHPWLARALQEEAEAFAARNLQSVSVNSIA